MFYFIVYFIIKFIFNLFNAVVTNNLTLYQSNLVMQVLKLYFIISQISLMQLPVLCLYISQISLMQLPIIYLVLVKFYKFNWKQCVITRARISSHYKKLTIILLSRGATNEPPIKLQSTSYRAQKSGLQISVTLMLSVYVSYKKS